jgi:hypothetical protein
MPLTTARRRDAANVQRSGNLANLHHTGRADGIDNWPHILRTPISLGSDGGLGSYANHQDTQALAPSLLV